jgi:hypothetical protein
VLQIANDILTKANRFAYGGNPIGKALSEVGGIAQQAGQSIRKAPNAVNIAGNLLNTGLGVANVLPQSLFHTLKMTPANRVGINTPLGRADLPGASSLALGLFTNPLGAVGKAGKAAQYLDRGGDITKAIKTFNLKIGNQVLKNVPKDQAAIKLAEAAKRGIPHTFEEVTQEMKNLDFAKSLIQAKNTKYLKDLKGKFAGSKKVRGTKPLIVYHGTDSDFSNIDVSKSTRNMFGRGFSVTTDPNMTKYYGSKQMKFSYSPDTKIYEGFKNNSQNIDFNIARQLYEKKFKKTLPLARARKELLMQKDTPDDYVYWKSENPEIKKAKELWGKFISAQGFDAIRQADTMMFLNPKKLTRIK